MVRATKTSFLFSSPVIYIYSYRLYIKKKVKKKTRALGVLAKVLTSVPSQPRLYTFIPPSPIYNKNKELFNVRTQPASIKEKNIYVIKKILQVSIFLIKEFEYIAIYFLLLSITKQNLLVWWLDYLIIYIYIRTYIYYICISQSFLLWKLARMMQLVNGIKYIVRGVFRNRVQKGHHAQKTARLR